MTKTRVTVIAVLLAASAASCAKRGPVPAPAPELPNNVFVLLADSDNHVGRIVVSNASGSQELGQAGAATRVASSASAPSPAFQMDQQEIGLLFGDALAAQPPPPVHFILYFVTNSTQLTEESVKLIPEIIRVVRDRDSSDISVVGHTDTTGDRELNDRLSMARAQAVARLLVDGGINPSFMETTAHGKDNPLVPTGDGVAEPRNRRVEVSVR
jgi:outer membrane protein OmpA-like peptidoglycan-associated protein